MYHRFSRYTLSLLLSAALFLSALLTPAAALARPAYAGPVTITDASGSEITIRNYGDEFFGYSTDMDGRLVIKDAEGYFRYVGEENGALTVLGRVAEGASAGAVMSKDVRQLRDKLNALILRLQPSGVSLYEYRLDRTDIPQGYDMNIAPSPLAGRIGTLSEADVTRLKRVERGSTCPLLVLMVDFSDVTCLFSEDEWATRIFDNAVPSYYSEVSNGQFTYVPAQESCNNNNGVIKVTLPFARPLYALNGPSNWDVQAGMYGDYAVYDTSSLFAHALREAEIQNYLTPAQVAACDRNTDGYISPTELAVILVVAGYDASVIGHAKAAGYPALWPHSGLFNNYRAGYAGWNYLSVRVAGKSFFKYTCMADNMNWGYNYANSTGERKQA